MFLSHLMILRISSAFNIFWFAVKNKKLISYNWYMYDFITARCFVVLFFKFILINSQFVSYSRQHCFNFMRQYFSMETRPKFWISKLETRNLPAIADVKDLNHWFSFLFSFEKVKVVFNLSTCSHWQTFSKCVSRKISPQP